ncbi:MAG: hypothetical protein ACJ8AW_02370, partial [Rhodopila sp.]
MMWQVRNFGIGLLALAGLALSPVPAIAQINAFGWSPDEPRLTNDDRQMLWDSMTSLNRIPSPPVGETKSWSNPASGNSGKVRVVGVSQDSGMPCHLLHYTIDFPA